MSKTGYIVILIVVVIVIFCIIIYYFNKDNDHELTSREHFEKYERSERSERSERPERSEPINSPNTSPVYNTSTSEEISDNIVDNILSQYNKGIQDINCDKNEVTPLDPSADQNGIFYNNDKNMSTYFDSDIFNSPDGTEFTYKKNKFTKKSVSDLNDQYDPENYLPQEIEDWFDIEPLQTTKKIKNSHLIHPKVHMGINTVGSSHRNSSHDIRGDIPNPKIEGISPWRISTIEPDTNRGLCGGY